MICSTVKRCILIRLIGPDQLDSVAVNFCCCSFIFSHWAALHACLIYKVGLLKNLQNLRRKQPNKHKLNRALKLLQPLLDPLLDPLLETPGKFWSFRRTTQTRSGEPQERFCDICDTNVLQPRSSGSGSGLGSRPGSKTRSGSGSGSGSVAADRETEEPTVLWHQRAAQPHWSLTRAEVLCGFVFCLVFFF